MDDNRRAAMLQEYSQVCNDFRMLTDIRFKLLAFLPIAAAAAAVLRKDFEGVAEFSLSIFGLTVTIALAAYNERNNQLYNDLVGRAATIERSLGLPDGAFANRLGPWLKIHLAGIKWKVDHGSAISLIYASSAALWLFGVLFPLVHSANSIWVQAGYPVRPVADPMPWIKGSALAAAICIVGYAVWSISSQKECRDKEMRRLARKLAKAATEMTLDDLAGDSMFLADCARLAGNKEETRIYGRLEYYRHWLSPESLGYYMPTAPSAVKGAHIVALLADLPPQWVFDCLTNRRGVLDADSKPDGRV